jgi:hypothetical protein
VTTPYSNIFWCQPSIPSKMKKNSLVTVSFQIHRPWSVHDPKIPCTWALKLQPSQISVIILKTRSWKCADLISSGFKWLPHLPEPRGPCSRAPNFIKEMYSHRQMLPEGLCASNCFQSPDDTCASGFLSWACFAQTPLLKNLGDTCSSTSRKQCETVTVPPHCHSDFLPH